MLHVGNTKKGEKLHLQEIDKLHNLAFIRKSGGSIKKLFYQEKSALGISCARHRLF